jgi:CRP-like cAMP-binding protein
MGADDLELLRAAGTESTIAAGQTLIERGQPGAGIFVIVEGDVVVEAPEGSRELGPGAVIGERALLSTDGKRTARVRAATEVRVVAVPREVFDELCAGDPGFAERIADSSL